MVKMKYLELLNQYDKDGYIYEYWLVNDKGKIRTCLELQHRRIVKQDTNLPDGYDVHHLNGNKKDNRRVNLLPILHRVHILIFHNIVDNI